MQPYICITHARADGDAAERLLHTLTAYGFRCHILDEASDPATRARVLFSAAQVLALTSEDADRALSVADDIDRLTERGTTPICLSLTEEENPLDVRFCRAESGTACVRIPYPGGKTPDAQAVGLFIHRLIIERLAYVEGVFSLYRCRRDACGRVIALSVAAHGGDREAAYALGCAYEQGDGVPVLENAAAAWITRAADADLADAKLHLGELCLSGWGVEPDERRAFALFLSVADAGDVRGEYRLGLCYLNGIGVVTDPIRAVYHLRRAARWKYAPALYRLGLLARDGIGTPTDIRAARRYLYDACRRGAAAERSCAAEDDRRYRIFDQAATDIPTARGEDDRSLSPEGTWILSDVMLDGRAEHRAERRAEHGDPLRLEHGEMPAAAFPPPPSLMGVRAERRANLRAKAVTVRRLRRRLPSASVHALAASTYTPLHRPEQAWIGSLTRSAHVSAAGLFTSGHPMIRVDRDDVAMGVPFDLSDVALALGGVLARGDAGVKPHLARALVWYRYALRRGNTEALYRLADAYRQGRGVPRDPAWAVTLYRLSADWGDARGQFALAVSCERGIGTDTDMAEAIRRYEQAAMAGYAPAQNNLGGCYEHGIGVARNELTAVEWYIRAAEAGLPEAMCRLGLCYECGRGVPTDTDHARALYAKAAKAGNPYAVYRLGILCDRDDAPTACVARYTEATQYWQSAAEDGVPEAAFALSMCYAMGHGVRRDLDRAVQHLHAAAEGGYLPALYRLGMCYLEGNGVVRNPARAVQCLREAVQLWRSRKSLYRRDTTPIPACTYAPAEAAADALYMLGFGVLDGWSETDAPADETERIRAAVALFSEAADLGHVGALIARGDLYAYGRMAPPNGTSAEAAARDFYERAVRVSAARRGVISPIPTDENILSALESVPLPPVGVRDARGDSLLTCRADILRCNSAPALMSLATAALRRGRDCAADPNNASDPAEAAEAFAAAHRYLSAAVEQGSIDARIGLSECMYYGYGQVPDRAAAFRLLQTAERSESRSDARMIVSLLMGDFLRGGWCGPCRPTEADDTYRRALDATPMDSEVGPYVVAERRARRMEQERQARAELLYRIATFRSVYFSDEAHGQVPPDGDRRETFAYLAEAVLMGHTAAREDLARMYAYERRYNAATAAAECTAQNRRGRRRSRHPAPRHDLRDHRLWLSDYYTALWPEPRPFRYELRSVALPSEIPLHITDPVTPVMMAAAMNYLGDCYFYGHGLDRRPAAAVVCYREVVRMKLDIPRGEAAPAGLVWAQYSLGWCLLHGEGTSRDEREAVRWLTAAARTHPEACFALGECHEHGLGVDNADPREAIKFYRRALKLGYAPAEAKVREIEELLRRRAEE